MVNERKGSKSENLNLRFEPRLKYLAGIQARNERRTLSHLVEAAVEAYLKEGGVSIGGNKESLLSLSDELWSVNQGERFVALASTFPHLLTYEEEHLWKIILERELSTIDKAAELERLFSDLQSEAVKRAAKSPTVTVGGFPFRAGSIDLSIPESITEITEEV